MLPWCEFERVPAHLRQPQARRRHFGDLAADPGEPRRDLMLEPALGHQLHTDADAEKWATGGAGGLDRLAHAGHRGEAARAVGEGALPGQYDAVGLADIVRV